MKNVAPFGIREADAFEPDRALRLVALALFRTALGECFEDRLRAFPKRLEVKEVEAGRHDRTNAAEQGEHRRVEGVEAADAW